jgi:calcineurin-like phosphoesterase family protein
MESYFISDLHLFHENAIRFDCRPFKDIDEMHETIMNNWNNRVTNADTVYILGDISLRGANNDLISYVSQLKGHKVLILGNHDRVNDYRYEKLFDEVTNYKVATISYKVPESKTPISTHVVMSHYPILMWNNQHRGYIHLYGHVHNSIEEIIYRECLEKLNSDRVAARRPMEKDVKAYNVGCMLPYMNYTPRTLYEIITGYDSTPIELIGRDHSNAETGKESSAP